MTNSLFKLVFLNYFILYFFLNYDIVVWYEYLTIQNKCSVTHLTKVLFPFKTLQNILNLKQKQKNESDYSLEFWIIEV